MWYLFQWLQISNVAGFHFSLQGILLTQAQNLVFQKCETNLLPNSDKNWRSPHSKTGRILIARQTNNIFFLSEFRVSLNQSFAT